MSPTPDEDLIAAVSRGDRAALSELYARHGDFVHRVAWRYLADGEEARDVTQAVFLGLIDGARHFRPEARFRTWLFRIVANRCLNHKARAESRLRAREVDDTALDRMAASGDGDPERLVQRHELQAQLLRALDALPPRQRLAMVLADVEGLSQREIGDALECSVGSVESLLVRARNSLRLALRDTRPKSDHPRIDGVSGRTAGHGQGE